MLAASLAILTAIAAQGVGHLFPRRASGEGDNVCPHHLAHEEDLQRINGILTA